MECFEEYGEFRISLPPVLSIENVISFLPYHPLYMLGGYLVENLMFVFWGDKHNIWWFPEQNVRAEFTTQSISGKKYLMPGSFLKMMMSEAKTFIFATLDDICIIEKNNNNVMSTLFSSSKKELFPLCAGYIREGVAAFYTEINKLLREHEINMTISDKSWPKQWWFLMHNYAGFTIKNFRIIQKSEVKIYYQEDSFPSY